MDILVCPDVQEALGEEEEPAGRSSILRYDGYSKDLCYTLTPKPYASCAAPSKAGPTEAHPARNGTAHPMLGRIDP